MIKLKLPENYQEKVEEVIKADDKEDMTYSYGFILREINQILDQKDIDSIHPGQIRVHESFNEWIMGLPEKDEYDVTQREWNLFLINKGPCTDGRVKEDEIFLLESEEEYHNYPDVIPKISQTVHIKINKGKSEKLIGLSSIRKWLLFLLLKLLRSLISHSRPV